MRRHTLAAVLAGTLVPTNVALVCAAKSYLEVRVEALEAISNAEPVVVDANGVILGALVDTMDGSEEGYSPTGAVGTVLLDIEGAPLLPVHVRRTLVRGTSRFIYFQSTDCSGDPLFAVIYETYPYSAPVVPFTFVDEETVYYSDRDAPRQLLAFESYKDSGAGNVCQSSGGTYNMVAGVRASLPSPMVPPFDVVTRADLAAH